MMRKKRKQCASSTLDVTAKLGVGAARPAKTFRELGDAGLLSATTVAFTAHKGFNELTPVQEVAIPLFMGAKDVAVQACTGSGKTLAFLIPIVERISAVLCPPPCSDSGGEGDTFSAEYCGGAYRQHTCLVGALIMSPTRELAGQIHTVLEEYISFVQQHRPAVGMRLCCSLMTGGCDVHKERSKLQTQIERTTNKANKLLHNSTTDLKVVCIVTGTPGRLYHMSSMMRSPQDWTFKPLEVLVIDEADKLMDNCFRDHFTRILSLLPKQRRTGLFSATLDLRLAELVKTGMRNPVFVRVNVNSGTAGGARSSDCGSAVRTSDAHSGSAAGSSKLGDEVGSAAVGEHVADEHGAAPPDDCGGGSSAEGSGSAYQPTHDVPVKLTNYVQLLKQIEKCPFIVKFLESMLTRPNRVGEDNTSLTTAGASAAPQSPPSTMKVMIFVLTCACADYYHSILSTLLDKHVSGAAGKAHGNCSSSNLLVVRLHGKMSQSGRVAALKEFTEGHCAVLVTTDVGARGIDVPHVDWILQVDPPQDPAMFVHRIGRTARAGRHGASLTLLQDSEDAYIQLIHRSGIQLSHFHTHPMSASVLLPTIHKISSSAQHMGVASTAAAVGHEQQGEVFVTSAEGSEFTASQLYSSAVRENVTPYTYNVLCDMKRVNLTNRATVNKATLAFVSYIRAYKEHKLGYIFPFKALCLGELANSLALLRIPRVREILGRKTPTFQQLAVDPMAIPYVEAKLEGKRQLDLTKDIAKRDTMKQKREERKLFSKKFDTRRHRRRKDVRRTQKLNTVKEITSMCQEELLTHRLRRGRLSILAYAAELGKIDKEDNVITPKSLADDKSDGKLPGWARRSFATAKRRKL